MTTNTTYEVLGTYRGRGKVKRIHPSHVAVPAGVANVGRRHDEAKEDRSRQIVQKDDQGGDSQWMSHHGPPRDDACMIKGKVLVVEPAIGVDLIVVEVVDRPLQNLGQALHVRLDAQDVVEKVTIVNPQAGFQLVLHHAIPVVHDILPGYPGLVVAVVPGDATAVFQKSDPGFEGHQDSCGTAFLDAFGYLFDFRIGASAGILFGIVLGHTTRSMGCDASLRAAFLV